MKLTGASRVFGGEGMLVEVTNDDGKKDEYLLLAEDFDLIVADGAEGLSREALETAGARYSALRAARSLLSYSSNTLAALTRKLRAKGYSKEAADFAVSRIDAEGSVDEPSDAKRAVELLLRRGWGPARIISHLKNRGFGKEAIFAASDMLSQTDFEPRLAAVIKKLYGDEGLPKEQAARRAAVARLCRLGYSMSDISRVDSRFEEY